MGVSQRCRDSPTSLGGTSTDCVAPSPEQLGRPHISTSRGEGQRGNPTRPADAGVAPLAVFLTMAFEQQRQLQREPGDKRRRTGDADAEDATISLRLGGVVNCVDQLDANLLARVLSFLGWKDVLKARACRRLREASLVTAIHDEVDIANSSGPHRDLGGFGAALPGMLRVRIPVIKVDEVSCRSVRDTDISLLSSFRYIKSLALVRCSLVVQSFPKLFGLTSLQTLKIEGVQDVRFGIANFSSLPNLKVIDCSVCRGLSGSIDYLSHLKCCLEYLRIESCGNIDGELTSALGEFLALRHLCLRNTNIRGDIRIIQPRHFPSLKELDIAQNCHIFGSKPLMTTEEARDLFSAWHRILSHPRPLPISEVVKQKVDLHTSSPEYYRPGRYTRYERYPPLTVSFVLVGPRIGYQWRNKFGMTCDINWLDAEPDATHDRYYVAYRAALRKLELEHQGSLYRGYSEPPTEEEWRQIVRE